MKCTGSSSRDSPRLNPENQIEYSGIKQKE
jgi:hypothetical protein